MATVVIDGVRYESKPDGELSVDNSCRACVAHPDKTDSNYALCGSLGDAHDCYTNKIHWVKHESQPADEWQGYDKIKYVPSVTQELKAFFGNKEFPSEAEEELFKALDEKLNTYDIVEKPKHYMLFEDKGIEVRDVIEQLVDKLHINGSYPPGAPLFEADYVQLMQYLMRFMDKNGVEDLKKARWYLDKMIGAYE